MGIFSNANFTIITRHYIILWYHFAKFACRIVLSAMLFIIIFRYRSDLPVDVTQFVLFPVALILLNYAFIKYILAIVSYYNKLVIITRDKFILIENTLMLREDIEIIELRKIVKIDIECHGVLAVLLNYGHFIVEQQRNDVRVMHFLPKPYDVLHVLKEHTNYSGIVRT